MKNNTQEILTFEISGSEGCHYLDIPVQKLVAPKFMIKGNNLYVFLYHYSQCFVVKGLPEYFLEGIPAGICYVRPKLNLRDGAFIITLI